jgi:hypothetical protein
METLTKPLFEALFGEIGGKPEAAEGLHADTFLTETTEMGDFN